MLPRIAVPGRLVADPELQFAQGSGKAFCNFRVVTNDRKQENGQWVDDPNAVLWQPCVAFGPLAEHIAESLVKGDLVIAYGRLGTKEWTDREGNRQSRPQLVCDDVGASLIFRAFPHRAAGAIDSRSAAPSPAASPADSDPWATPAPVAGVAVDDPPF